MKLLSSTQIPIAICILVFLLCGSAGCISIPLTSDSSENISLANITENITVAHNLVSDLLPQETVTYTPAPTSSIEHADSFYAPENRYTPRRTSVGYERTTDGRILPHTVYIENNLELNTSAPLGRIVTVLHGPFIIDYTIHPKVNNPLVEWATIEVRDPWGDLIADGGYNQHYPSTAHQQILIYRTGTFYLKIEGNFITMDIGVQTTDPIPSVTPTPVAGEE